jgi:hypothetical protein
VAGLLTSGEQVSIVRRISGKNRLVVKVEGSMVVVVVGVAGTSI